MAKLFANSRDMHSELSDLCLHCFSNYPFGDRQTKMGKCMDCAFKFAQYAIIGIILLICPTLVSTLALLNCYSNHRLEAAKKPSVRIKC